MKKYSLVPVMLLIAVLSSCTSMNTTMKKLIPTADGRQEAVMTAAWIKNLDPVYDSGNLPIALQSPLISEGIVYAEESNSKERTVFSSKFACPVSGFTIEEIEPRLFSAP